MSIYDPLKEMFMWLLKLLFWFVHGSTEAGFYKEMRMYHEHSMEF